MIFRTVASLITAVGCCMLAYLLYESTGPFGKDLLLSLPVPLHVIFIGLIIQKKYFTPPWQRFAWIGITGSGVWLGISLAIRTFAS